jgi:hypothetical protein
VVGLPRKRADKVGFQEVNEDEKSGTLGEVPDKLFEDSFFMVRVSTGAD